MSNARHALACHTPLPLKDCAHWLPLLWRGRVVMRCEGPGWYVGDLGTGVRHQLTRETPVQIVLGLEVVRDDDE